MFGLVVRFDCLDVQSAEGFDVLTAETVAQITALEPGTLVYSTHPLEGEPTARVFYELYRDRGAFDDHNSQPHTRRFLDTRERFLASQRVEFLTAGPAKGLPRTT
jgi:quinol monooxygenase YgiN